MIVNITGKQPSFVPGVTEKSNKDQEAQWYLAISQLAVLDYLKVPSVLSCNIILNI